MRIPTSTRSTPRATGFAGDVRRHRRGQPLTDDVLELVAALDAPAAEWPGVLTTRAIYLDSVGRRREAAMYFREAARLADELGATWHGAMAGST